MSRPKNLEWPCTICPKYDRTDKDLGDMAKHLLQVSGEFKLGRCKFHPLYSPPDMREKCPYSRFVGKTEVVEICDLCGKEFDTLKPGDPRLENGLRDFGESACDECRKTGRTSPKDGVLGPIIILPSKTR